MAEHLSQDWKTSDETWVTGHDKQDVGIHPSRSMRLSEGVTSVDVIKHGRVVVIVASEESWAEWFDGLRASNDLPDGRKLPPAQARTPF